jgi:DNA-binding SARP family transcriptional activator
MDRYRVSLLGGFSLRCADAGISLPPETQRLVAFLCVKDMPVERSHAAGLLWGDFDEDRSRACLRSSLWRVRRLVKSLLVTDSSSIALAPTVDSDVRDLQRQSSMLWGDEQFDPTTLDRRMIDCELLPGWYDEWVVVERERIRQLRLHCLEAAAEVLCQRGLFGAAIQSLLTAITLDHLRESSQRQLMSVHIAEGNLSEAVRQYRDFAQVLARELGLQPSAQMRDLLESAGVPVGTV